MATKRKAPQAAPEAPQAAEVAAPQCHIVNARGAIHEVAPPELAELLTRPGWRLATAEEVAELARRGGNQTTDDPIVKG